MNTLQSAEKTNNAENKDKNYLLAMALSYFVGGLGVDRFYLGYIPTGVIKLLTLGGLGIWSLIDIIRIAFGGLRAKGSAQPLEGYNKYTKTMSMVVLIVLAVQIVVFLAYGALIAFATVSGLRQRDDVKTYSNAETIANDLNGYVNTSHSIPDDLTVLSSFDPIDTIKYTKDSDQSYTFCVKYKISGSVDSDNADGGANQATVTDALYLPTNHKAGWNCQTISPPDTQFDQTTALNPVVPEASLQASGIAVGCGVAGIESEDTPTSGQMTKTPTGTVNNGVAEYILTKPSRGGGSLWKIAADTPVYDIDCQPLAHDKVLSGDYVDIFTIPKEGTSIVGDPLIARVVIDHTKH